MRCLVCTIALLGRFAGQGYVRRAGPAPRPVPIERRLPAETRNGTLPARGLTR